jgi:predicted MFS family arabinose efflux permease
MLRLGVAQTWLGLGMLAGLLTIMGWNGWVAPSTGTGAPAQVKPVSLPARQLRTLYATYGLSAFALVPHMLFLVDYVSRGLGRGLASGTHYWVIFGLGSIAGPVLAGRLADRAGYRATLLLILVTQTIAIGLPAFLSGPVELTVSSFITGACTIGIVPVVLGRTCEMLRHHPAAQTAAWRTATTSFALFQAGGAYIFSFLLNWSGGNYRLVFGLGSAAVALALILNVTKQEIAESQRKLA